MGLAAAATADLRSQDLVGPQGSCQFQVGGATLAVLALSSLSRKKLHSKFSFFIQITSLFFHLFFCSCFPQPHAVSASSQRTTAPFQDCYQVSRLQDSKELKSTLSCRARRLLQRQAFRCRLPCFFCIGDKRAPAGPTSIATASIYEALGHRTATRR